MNEPEAHARAGRRPTTWIPYVVLGAVALACLVVATVRSPAPETAEDRINAVAETIKCPTCQGESVADSNAPTSREIRAFYSDRYGAAILLTPSRSGVTSIVWILPVVALAGAITGLVVVFRRWRGPTPAHASDEDRALVDRARDDRGREGPP